MSLLYKWFYVLYTWGQNIVDFFTMTIIEMVGLASLPPPFNEFVDYLMPLFGNWTLFQLIFGVGFATVIVLTLVKWVIGIIM